MVLKSMVKKFGQRKVSNFQVLIKFSTGSYSKKTTIEKSF